MLDRPEELSLLWAAMKQERGFLGAGCPAMGGSSVSQGNGMEAGALGAPPTPAPALHVQNPSGIPAILRAFKKDLQVAV